jgi:hypothetical protein
MDKMKFENADVKFAINILSAIVWGVAAKRAIEAANPHSHENFWRVINSEMYDAAISKWCILFGSHSEDFQQLHWKNMFENDSFREGLLSRLGVSKRVWFQYWNDIKTYRDELAAHQSLNPSSESYPDMSMALEAAYYYFECLKPRLREMNSPQQNLCLKTEYQRTKAHFDSVAKRAIYATNN